MIYNRLLFCYLHFYPSLFIVFPPSYCSDPTFNPSNQNRSVLFRKRRALVLNLTWLIRLAIAIKNSSSFFWIRENPFWTSSFPWWMLFNMHNWIKLYMHNNNNIKKAGINRQLMKVLYLYINFKNLLFLKWRTKILCLCYCWWCDYARAIYNLD